MVEYARGLNLKDGQTIVYSEAQSPTLYVNSGWNDTVWSFETNALPSLITATSPSPPSYDSNDISRWVRSHDNPNGAFISIEEAYEASKYIDSGWTSDVWSLEGESLPTLIPFTPDSTPSYENISFERWERNHDKVNGGIITLEEAKQRVTYEQVPSFDLSWMNGDPYVMIGTRYQSGITSYGSDGIGELIFVFSEIPKIDTDPVPPTGNGTFYFDSGSAYMTRYLDTGEKVGALDYSRSSVNSATFVDIKATNFDVYDRDGNLRFENTNLDPADLSEKDYPDTSWNFDTTWAIIEGETFPIPLKKGESESPIGDPLSSSKFNIFVEPDRVNGTMYFNNEIYRSLGWSERIDTKTGAKGDTVTYTYDGPEREARNGEMFTFLASGIQDPSAPGNFSSYTTETERTVPLLEDRSNHVNFYYISPTDLPVEEPTEPTDPVDPVEPTDPTEPVDPNEPTDPVDPVDPNEPQEPTDPDTGVEPEEPTQPTTPLPDYDFVTYIGIPERVLTIALSSESVSEIKVQIPDGVLASAVLVPTDSEHASPIHVETEQGILALCEVK